MNQKPIARAQAPKETELCLSPGEGGDLAFVFARVPGAPPQFVARILQSLQSYYALTELEA